MKRELLTSFLTFFCFVLLAQSTLVDERDGRTYHVIQIGNLRWMGEDLKFETPFSHCPTYDMTGEQCSSANYYSYLERDELCPKGWRLPTIQDWEEVIATLDETKTVRLMERNKRLYRLDLLDKYNFFDQNPLNIEPVGRTEGNVWQDGHYSDYWTINQETEDPRFHMHFSPYTLVGHAHKQNVSAKKESKNRKFAVRCVCDKNH